MNLFDTKVLDKLATNCYYLDWEQLKKGYHNVTDKYTATRIIIDIESTVALARQEMLEKIKEIDDECVGIAHKKYFKESVEINAAVLNMIEEYYTRLRSFLQEEEKEEKQ